MTAMTHRESLDFAFLRAVCEEPHEDAHRLAFSDWLEENAGTVPCDKCGGEGWSSDWQGGPGSSKCYTCRATGRVPDGRKERAEFVRVQCELACHCPPLSPPVNGVRSGLLCGACEREHYRLDEYAALRRRERELLAKNWFAWSPHIDHHIACGNRDSFPQGGFDPSAGHIVCTFRRGFVSEVMLSAADFAGGVCGRCGHTEHVGIAAPYTDEPCPVCGGTGRTPGLAGALFAAAPVERVTLTDKRPGRYGDAWAWWRNDTEAPAIGSLPPVLHNLLPPDDYPAMVSGFASEDDALSALSAACVTFGRLAAAPPAPKKDGAR